MVGKVFQYSRQVPLKARHGENNAVAVLNHIHYRLNFFAVGASPVPSAKAAAAACAEGQAYIRQVYFRKYNIPVYVR